MRDADKSPLQEWVSWLGNIDIEEHGKKGFDEMSTAKSAAQSTLGVIKR